MKNEKLLFHYAYHRDYKNDPLNFVGATTSTTLRTVTSHSDSNCKYVKKFGTQLAVKSISACTYGASQTTGAQELVVRFYSATTNTLLGTISDLNGSVGSFVAGSTLSTAEPMYVKYTCDNSTFTTVVGKSITITTDAGSLTFVLPAETMNTTDRANFSFYISTQGSSYYDVNLKHGGYRITPTGTQAKPYYDIGTALGVLGGAFTICTVLDSENYNEVLNISAGYVLQSVIGHTPTISRKIGPSSVREVTQYNNDTAVYVNENGSDSNNGTWQSPFLTVTFAKTSRGSKAVVYGGNGATELSGLFYESVTISTNDFTLDAEYGYTPAFKYDYSLVANVTFLDLSANSGWHKIYGWTFDCSGSTFDSAILLLASSGGSPCKIKYNKIIGVPGTKAGIHNGSQALNLTVEYNIITSCVRAIQLDSQNASDIVIKYNHITSISEYAILIAGAGSSNLPVTIEHNYIMDVGINGIYFAMNSAKTWTGNISNNLIKDVTQTGIRYNNVGGSATISFTTEKNILINCVTYGVEVTNTAHAINYNGFYGNGTNVSALITNNNPITSAPKFIDEVNDIYGLNPTSPYYKADGSENDIGPGLRIILIGSNNVTINGFIFNGDNYCCSAIQKTGSADYTGMILKWCTIEDFTGCQIDDYSGATTLSQILNCYIQSGGVGINCKRGSNVINYCIVNSNISFGSYLNYGGSQIKNSVFYGNDYGIYFGYNTGGNIIQNVITQDNSFYGIYSPQIIYKNQITYSCFADGTSQEVDFSDTTNLNNNPLFISTEIGAENFNLKSLSSGFYYDSPCLGSGFGGADIGCYIIDRSVENESWQKYQLYNNPYELNDGLKLKGVVDFENADGVVSKFGKAHKKTFELNFADSDDQTEEQINKLKHISALAITRENGLLENDVAIRLHFLPDQKVMTGTGTIDATAKTIALASATQENKYKGYWVGVKFTTGTGMVISASGKTGTKSGAGWTVNQWVGYYLYLNFNYYYILSNTATILTLSDPDGYLVDETVAYSIEKYFKIIENDKLYLRLDDPDDELPAGSYAYYVDFILVKVINNSFDPRQEGFFFQRYESKTQFSLIFEEI